MNDIYVYAEPVHNLHFYYVWAVYYFQYLMLNLGGSGVISSILWFRVGRAVRSYKHESIQKEDYICQLNCCAR